MNLPGLWMTQSGSMIYRVVPKCACSTIGQVMFASEAGRFYDGDIHTTPPGVLRKWGRPEDRPAIVGAVKSGQGTVFTCVRNPFSRILSGFFDKVASLQENGRWYRRHVIAPLRERYGIVIGTPETGFQFDQIAAFRRFLLMVRDAHLFRTPGNDMHWAPLTSTVGTVIQGGARFDRVLFTEDLRPGLQSVLAEARPSHAVNLETMPRFNESGVTGPRIAHPPAAFFDDLSMHLMHEIYGDDFRLFNYDPSDPSRARPLGEVDLDRLHRHFAKPARPAAAGSRPAPNPTPGPAG